MTKENKGHYAKKHLHDSEVKPEIEAALKQLASNGEIPCAVAFKIAADLDIEPGDVGVTADLLEMRLIKCQLGLFGYQPAKRIVEPVQDISKGLEEDIRKGLENGKLPCGTAWEVAKDLGIRKMEVSSACEALKIKIGPCQIGAF
ncbi:MAG: hypothetical protein MUO68_18870 [Desulfobacteraceae bacterium]|jgi:hypothetical protein|nr:hypothetical protein [Desulfobacteraceae bacterium]